MNSSQFIFDGHILSELSSQIPSDIFALNELIKNSYDAMASTISIILNTQNKTLTITDDGKGMGQEEIRELFHISHSSKKYGILNNNRYIQGSKGLGALAAFRFGTQVTWTTRKNNTETNLTIDRDDAIKNENLTNYEIPTETKETHDEHGTSITMKLTDDTQQTLEDELRNPLISSRIVYAFLPKTETRRDNPNDVDIQILINRETIAQRYLPALNMNIASIMPNRQRAEITYNSEKTNTASIIRNGKEIKRILLEPIPSDDFTVHFHLVYFKLDGIKHKERETIPPLFKTEKRTITPQIFINENLFDSPDLFDPEINRRKRNDQSAPQFIGYVCINSVKVIFNPDRTQLSETPLNKKIKAFLASINSQLQREVAKYLPMGETSENTSEPTITNIPLQPELSAENTNPTNCIKTEEVEVKDQNSNISGNLQTAKIVSDDSYPIVPLHEFDDETTPLEIHSQELQYPLNSLIKQINRLYKNGEYELSACGLRVFFELPISKLRKYKGSISELKQVKQIAIKLDNDGNDKKYTVQYQVLKLIKIFHGSNGETIGGKGLNDEQCQKIRTKVMQKLEVNEYTIKNEFAKYEGYANAAEQSNLGSHSSNKHLSRGDFEEIANKAGAFAAIVDALLSVDTADKTF